MMVRRWGRHKLLRILGEGGYGIVYLADQQRLVKRRVALKVIKPGNSEGFAGGVLVVQERKHGRQS